MQPNKGIHSAVLTFYRDHLSSKGASLSPLITVYTTEVCTTPDYSFFKQGALLNLGLLKD